MFSTRKEDESDDWKHPGKHSDYDHVLVANPADIFYLSGDGTRRFQEPRIYGKKEVGGKNYSYHVSLKETDELMVTPDEVEWLVLSVCHQAGFDESVVAAERNIFGKDATSSPGVAWYEAYIKAKKVHGILGFVGNGWSGKRFSETFVNGLKTKSILQAWKDTYYSATGFRKAKKWPGAITRTEYVSETLSALSNANPSGGDVQAWSTYEKPDGSTGQRTVAHTKAPSLLVPYNIEVDLAIDQDTIWEKGKWSGYTFGVDANAANTLTWMRSPQGETRRGYQTERRNDNTAMFTAFQVEIYGLVNGVPNMATPAWTGTKTIPGAGTALNVWASVTLPAGSLVGKGTKRFIWRVKGTNAAGESSWWSPMYELEIK